MESTDSLIRQLNRSHTPTEVPLVPDAGVQRQAVVGGVLQAAPVGLGDLGHGGDIGPGTLLGGEGDLVPGLQGMDFAEIAVGSAIVRRETNISVPDGGFLEVTHALLQRGAVRALDDLDIQADGGNLQRAQQESSQSNTVLKDYVLDCIEKHSPGTPTPGGLGKPPRSPLTVKSNRK